MTDIIYENTIQTVFENEEIAVLYKPRGVPTAPILKTQTNTLLNYFLCEHPECKNVCGKKEIEAGLIHRLDTPTAGLVLIAKTQYIYDKLIYLQGCNFIKKTYTAFCEIVNKKKLKDIKKAKLPHLVQSQFRPFGPKGKKVAAVFSDSYRFLPNGKVYATTLCSIEHFSTNYVKVMCTLTQGYRHQVRTHLASIGLPIYGDALYNQNYTASIEELNLHSYPLQLYATGISLPITKMPKSFSNKILYIQANQDECANNKFMFIKNKELSFLLPQPNKMNL